MNLICTFTSGRTGTGYLSQIFGGEYSKSALHNNGNSIVTHESWREIKDYVYLLKKNGKSERMRVESNSRINEHLLKFGNIENYFITDHRVGRYFLWAYAGPYKIIRIKRKKTDIVTSFQRRINETREKVSSDVFSSFYNEIWSKSFYHPADKFIGDYDSENLWGSMGDADRISWYVDEVDRQWDIIVNSLEPNSFIEMEFPELFTSSGMDKISEFIDIKYNVKFLKERVNR